MRVTGPPVQIMVLIGEGQDAARSVRMLAETVADLAMARSSACLVLDAGERPGVMLNEQDVVRRNASSVITSYERH
jgi:hypothetical protein